MQQVNDCPTALCKQHDAGGTHWTSGKHYKRWLRMLKLAADFVTVTWHFACDLSFDMKHVQQVPQHKSECLSCLRRSTFVVHLAHQATLTLQLGRLADSLD